jgi:hypothetical protein
MHRVKVEFVVEVHGDDAAVALFALVMMDLSRRLRPHGSRPASLRCCSLESMREPALDHDALIRRCVPVPARFHARRILLQDQRGALVWIPPHHEHLKSRVVLGIAGFHGMASLVVKVPWVAPDFEPSAGVAPVPRSCAKDCVAFITVPFLILLSAFSALTLPNFLVTLPLMPRALIRDIVCFVACDKLSK